MSVSKAFDGFSGSQIATSSMASINTLYRPGDGDPEKPALVLLHGYPQNHYMFRHLIPLLPKDYAIILPDLPGYGDSSANKSTKDTNAYSKRSMGKEILDVMSRCLQSSTSTPRKIILIGHDRGARVAHRMAIDMKQSEKFKVIGVVVADIVPTLENWKRCCSSQGGDNKIALKMYHWMFLAQPYPRPEKMIQGAGVEWFIPDKIASWAGQDKYLEKLKEGGAMDVYVKSFRRGDVVNGSCNDYRAGATVDVEEQREDQERGDKLEVPTFALHSIGNLGPSDLIRVCWKDWVKDEGLLRIKGLEGPGHFVFEEDPERSAKEILNWMRTALNLSV
ncbi:alpha/beta-hydrolase [Saitoella complicata NRRL Y-17804]|uniref:AB hydrolase-1 domain-containing protein n=1 Tax=Saitoella complicata (strain BCRC 22490 / CBS 7301 / JCM 7358 / NBRC 10748 / NRRL Y-17804) TaxID=698492 RepID=A0A0E9NF52_SAICN|nr:alpha/beta-hydrolase [Saitoella complicata NRRL Y-17804]ODQ52912.1 alpha/beta-hydrolase [Saitoella complicata NRRL Y-17804]GAO48464.1 hypothetical protein G7K_2637-t1 [Saitoella complicata NRRL Y-17804]